MLGFSSIADSAIADLRQDALIAVTGVSATTTAHSVTISADAVLAQTGQTVTSATHSVTASGDAVFTPTAQTITSGINSVNVISGDVLIAGTSAGTILTTVNPATVGIGITIDLGAGGDILAENGDFIISEGSDLIVTEDTFLASLVINSAINSAATPILVDSQTVTALLNSVTVQADADVAIITAATLSTTVHDIGVDFSMAVYPTGITVTTRVNSRPIWRPIVISAGGGWHEIIT